MGGPKIVHKDADVEIWRYQQKMDRRRFLKFGAATIIGATLTAVGLKFLFEGRGYNPIEPEFTLGPESSYGDIGTAGGKSPQWIVETDRNGNTTGHIARFTKNSSNSGGASQYVQDVVLEHGVKYKGASLTLDEIEKDMLKGITHLRVRGKKTNEDTGSQPYYYWQRDTIKALEILNLTLHDAQPTQTQNVQFTPNPEFTLGPNSDIWTEGTAGGDNPIWSQGVEKSGIRSTQATVKKGFTRNGLRTVEYFYILKFEDSVMYKGEPTNHNNIFKQFKGATYIRTRGRKIDSIADESNTKQADFVRVSEILDVRGGELDRSTSQSPLTSTTLMGTLIIGGASAGALGYYVRNRRVASRLAGAARGHLGIYPDATQHYQEPPTHPNIPARTTFSTGKNYRPPSPKSEGSSYAGELLREIDEVTKNLSGRAGQKKVSMTKTPGPDKKISPKNAEEIKIFRAVEESSNREEAVIALATETGESILDMYKYLTPQLYAAIKSRELKPRGKN